MKDDPFDDLNEELAEDESDETNDVDEPAPETETEDTGGLDSPAFPYDDVRQGPIYPREESWAGLDDALTIDVAPHLQQQGVRNVEKREIHDAMVQLAIENPEQLAEIVLNAREDDE